MEKAKYNKLLGEVYNRMKGERLDAALQESRSPARVDAVQDIMRTAIQQSTISKFNGLPYFYGGRIYEEMSWDDFGNLVYDLMRKCNLPNGDYSRIEGILRVCKRAVSGKELKPNNAIVVFRNCVFDMETKQRYPFSSRFIQTTQVDYDYNPKEHIFMWKMFIEQVLPNETIRNVLQEFLGSIFVDRHIAKMETMLILRGGGSNGKSVIFETVMGILGRENVSNFGIGVLINGSERKKNIAFINGKRLNYCSEIQAIEIGKDSDVLKALISGEPTEARPIYGENFTAYNLPLLMANANHLPYLKDWSYGMRRRLCIIPFEVEIPKEKQIINLAQELVSEYSAIFNWILEGRDRFIANGYKLSDCKELEDVMDEYQSESSSVIKFMYKMGYLSRPNNVTGVEPKWITSTELYGQYKIWCINYGEDIESVASFGRILVNAGYKKKHGSSGNMYGLYGTALRHKLKYKRMKELGELDPKGSYRQRISTPIERDGIRWAKTVEGLAYCLHLPVSRITTLFHQGKLDGMYKKEGRTCYFNLDIIEDKLRELMAEFNHFAYDKKKEK